MDTSQDIAPSLGGGQSCVLVTGCAGFLGSQLTERLLDEDIGVIGVDCFTDFYPRSLKDRNIADLRDQAAFNLQERDIAVDPLDDLVEQVDAIYHLAAQAGVRGSFGDGFQAYLHNNVRGTQRLLEATVRNPVETFVYASSSSVYGNAAIHPTPETAPRAPVSPYGMTKCATEDLAGVYRRNHGLHTVGLRYFTAYGPRQRPDMAFARFVTAGLSGKKITIFGDGFQIRDFTYVDDVVDATLLAGRHGGSGAIYNVGGGTPVTLLEAIRVLEEKIGQFIAVEHGDSARGDARQTGSDTSRARKELGFSPSVSLEEGLALQVEWAMTRSPEARVALS